MLLLLIIGSTVLSGARSVGLASLALLLPEPSRRRLTPVAVGYATGTLLGAALLGLLPRALQDLPAHHAMATVLGGLPCFFLLERLAVWRHCHAKQCEIHSSTAMLILLGDALHNFVDGVAISVAFIASVPLGGNGDRRCRPRDTPRDRRLLHPPGRRLHEEESADLEHALQPLCPRGRTPCVRMDSPCKIPRPLCHGFLWSELRVHRAC